MEEQLQTIGDILGSKFSSYLVFHSRQSEFNVSFPTPIKLNPNRNYELALHYFCISNHLVNITEINNKFIYSHDSGKIFTTLTFETGAYEITQISNEIKRQMIINKHYDEKQPPLTIGVNLSTFKSYIDITNPNYQVDFGKPKTIKDLLGFDSKIIKSGYNISDKTVQITNTSAICLKCDLVSGSYINGVESNLLFSVPAYLVPVGYKLVANPPNMFYLPINRKIISQISFRITDEEDNTLDFKGEEVVIALHIRQV
jgi:hypothetical protein